MIYYDVIEDVLPVTFVNNEDLENIYCDSQYGITGLFSYLLGFAYGLPPMHNIENGFTRIGKFGLMDQGSFNGRGIVPALPNPWTRINFLSSNLINITDSLLNLDYDLEIEKRTTIDNIYRIDISDGEYFLLEHSNNTFLFDDQITSISEIISDSLNNENAADVYWLDILNLINVQDNPIFFLDLLLFLFVFQIVINLLFRIVIYNNLDLLESLGDNGNKYVKINYNRDNLADQMIHLIKSK